MISDAINHGESDRIRDLLLGRRVVQATHGIFDIGKWSHSTGMLVLDNGVKVYILPNQGGCACSAGDYELTALATADNIITDVRLTVEGDPGDYNDSALSYRIYVVADATVINLVRIDGDDGNGYYGTGYELFVEVPDA